MTFCPFFVLFLWEYNFSSHLGSYSKDFMALFSIKSLINFDKIFNKETISHIFLFMIFQAILIKFLPGKTYKGPLSKTGFTPQYKDNGLLAYTLTLSVYLLLTYGLNLFSPSYIYDRFSDYLTSLCFFSIIFCLLLYLKGKLLPSAGEFSSSGSFIFDYYWGVELYPRIFGVDVKLLTNCRFGMMTWVLIGISFAHKQYEVYGFLSSSMMVSLFLQFVYCSKFFIWEKGYMRSTDIKTDRAGFYICWGCLVWVPGFYSSVTAYLVHHPLQSYGHFFWLILGLFAIWVNYAADRERVVVREKNGHVSIWGKPAQFIRAQYNDAEGIKRESLLLTSGFWGLSRHFHYIPELTATFCWTAVAGFESLHPYFYFIFLFILLMHRIYREEAMCAKKYKCFWQQYCVKVPYVIFPRIF